MIQQDILKQLEREAYLKTHEDGILDLILGLTLLGIGFHLASKESTLSILVWMSVLFYKPLKDRITVPRLGHVRFGKDRMKKQSQGMTAVSIGISLLLLAGSCLFFFAKTLPVWIHENLVFMAGAVVSIVLFLNGILHGIRKLILYSAGTMALSVVYLLFPIPLSWTFLLLGGLTAAYGLYQMIRFIMRTPLEPTAQKSINEGK